MSLSRLYALFAAITLLVSGSALGHTLNWIAISSEPEVISSEFGLFNPPGSENPAFVPAKVVPLIPEQSYGWLIKLRTDKPTIRWREEFTLPAKPDTWGAPESQGTRSLSSDSRTATTEREVEPDQGIISNIWAVAPGDPKGQYLIRVFIEDALVGVFEFEVQ